MWTTGHELYHMSRMFQGVPIRQILSEDHRGGAGSSPADRFGRTVRFGPRATFDGLSESQAMAVSAYARAWLERRLSEAWSNVGFSILRGLSR
jgi:hypothetical protein